MFDSHPSKRHLATAMKTAAAASLQVLG